MTADAGAVGDTAGEGEIQDAGDGDGLRGRARSSVVVLNGVAEGVDARGFGDQTLELAVWVEAKVLSLLAVARPWDASAWMTEAATLSRAGTLRVMKALS